MTKLRPNWRPVSEVTPEMDDKDYLICTVKRSVYVAWYNAEMDKFVVAYLEAQKDYVTAKDVTHFASFEVELPEEAKDD